MVNVHIALLQPPRRRLAPPREKWTGHTDTKPASSLMPMMLQWKVGFWSSGGCICQECSLRPRKFRGDSKDINLVRALDAEKRLVHPKRGLFIPNETGTIYIRISHTAHLKWGLTPIHFCMKHSRGRMCTQIIIEQWIILGGCFQITTRCTGPEENHSGRNAVDRAADEGAATNIQKSSSSKPDKGI